MKTTGTPSNIGDCAINPSSDPGALLSVSGDITVIDKTVRTFNIQIQCFDLDHPFKGIATESKAQVTISIEIMNKNIAEYPQIFTVQANPGEFHQGDTSIQPHVDFSPMIDDFQDTINQCSITFSLRASKYNSNYPTHFEDPQDIVATKQVRLKDSQQSGTFQFFIDAHGSNNYEPQHFGPFDIIVCPEVVPGQYNCGYAYSQLIESISFPQRQQVCTHNDLPEIRYGPLTNHFVSQTNNIGNCNGQSTNSIIYDPVTSFVSLSDKTSRIQALEFECEDLDFSSNDAYRTLEAENIRLEIINLDVFKETSFTQINNISQVVDENNLPSFDFSDFIDAIQSQIDACQITFEVWTSESDPSPSINFTPLDINGAKEVKLTSSQNLKCQYSFWLVSKVSFIGQSQPQLSKKLFTVTAERPSGSTGLYCDIPEGYQSTKKQFYLPWKPILLDPPEDTVFEFDVWESTNHFNLTLSERIDQNGDQVSLEIFSGKFGNISTSQGLFKARQMRFDNETNVLFFEIKHSEMPFFNGTHVIRFTLKDNSQQKLTRTYQIEVQFILPDVYVESDNDFGLQAQELLEFNVQREMAKDNFTAKIAEVNSFGNASILFNKPMITNFIDLEAINSSVMDVYIQPFRNWHEDQEGFEVYPNLNFTWNVTSFEGSYLNFTMVFSNPYQISPLYLRDNLVVHIFENASNYFISEDYIPFASLEESKRTMVHDIPKQMDMGNNLVSKYTEIAYKMVLGTEIVGLIMTPLDSRQLYYVLSMVNNLQLIGHFPMISIPMPPNVFIVFQYLVKIVTFDIVTDEHREQIKNLLKIEEVEEEVVDISPQMQEIGYESHKFWVSMDVICVFEALWIVRIFLVFGPIAFLIWLVKKYETMNDEYKEQLQSSQYSFYEQQYLDRLPKQTKTEKEQEPKKNVEENKNAGSEGDDEGLKFDPNYNDVDPQDSHSNRKSINSDEQIQEQLEGGDKDVKQPMTKEQGLRIVRMLTDRDMRLEEIQEDKEKLKKPIVVPEKTLSQWVSEKREAMKRSIFFSEITVLNVEAFLEFAICFFLQKDSQDQSWVAILLGIHTFLLIPGVLIWVFMQRQETLESEQFIERWGNLYIDFNYQERASRLYYLVFLLKRILFVTICYFEVFKTRQWLTIIILYLFNLLSCLYSGLQKPYKEKPRNRIDFVNDFFFCGHLALMMCYTGFVEHPFNQFVAGWIHIFYICVHLLYNIFFMVKAQLYSLYQLIYSLYFDPKRQAEEWSISKLKKLILEKRRLRKGRYGVTQENVTLDNANIPVEILKKIYQDLEKQEEKANKQASREKETNTKRINQDSSPNKVNQDVSVDQIEPGRISVEPLGIKSSKKKNKTLNKDQTQTGRKQEEPKDANESPIKIFKSPSIDSIQTGKQAEEPKDFQNSPIKISKSGDDDKSPPVKKSKKPKKKKKRAKRKAAIADQTPAKAPIMEIQDYQIDDNQKDLEPVGYPNLDDFAHIDYNDPNDNPFAEFTPEAIAAKKEKQEREDYDEAKKREQEYIDEKIKEVSRDQNCSMEEAIRFWYSYERIRFEKMMKEDRVYNKYQKKFWNRIEEEAFVEKTKDYFTTSPRLINSDNDHPFWKEFTEAEQAAAEDSWYEKKKSQIEQENEILAQEKEQINQSHLGGDAMSLQRNENYYF